MSGGPNDLDGLGCCPYVGRDGGLYGSRIVDAGPAPAVESTSVPEAGRPSAGATRLRQPPCSVRELDPNAAVVRVSAPVSLGGLVRWRV